MLFQLGGPDSLEAVEPFLLNLFLDPDIIPLGPFGLLRRPIAKLISSRRSVPVAEKYAEIGGRSPIGALTERQRVRLVEALSPHIDAVAVTAMRYWHPLTSEAVAARIARAIANSAIAERIASRRVIGRPAKSRRSAQSRRPTRRLPRGPCSADPRC